MLSIGGWMSIIGETPFERYADDVIVHGRSQAQTQRLKEEITQRLAECGLELHPEKTKIVYCRDGKRRKESEHEKFTFLSYDFQAREATSFRGRFVSFLPAISGKAIGLIRERIRTWKVHLRSDLSLEELSHRYNPIVRGWVQYYGRFYRSRLEWVFAPFEEALVRWAGRKYKKFHRHPGRARHWLRRISQRLPSLFAHWQIAVSKPVSSMGAV
jgi:RNA-directed DNA polymerase